VIYEPSYLAIGVFAFFVAIVLGISFYLGAKAKSAAGYYAAHGEIPWFVNGVAFAGDYLSAASFLGICGMIAFYGYDGFLYSIGYLAGWVVALLVIAEPLKRLGKFTFADALDAKFHSPGIRLTAAVSTLVVSIFYLIPQMVGAGALIRPLLGLESLGLQPYHGVIGVGVIVIVIVVTAGMVSTTWVQFIKGAMLVGVCTVLVGMILARGLTTEPQGADGRFKPVESFWGPEKLTNDYLAKQQPHLKLASADPAWDETRFVWLDNTETGLREVWAKQPQVYRFKGSDVYARGQYQTVQKDGATLINGLPRGKEEGQADFHSVGQILSFLELERETSEKTGPLDPVSYFSAFSDTQIATWDKSPPIKEAGGAVTIVYYPRFVFGRELLLPGTSPTFSGIRSNKLTAKLDFLSLMLALFAGTASLPHILIRYYTVKDQASARNSTVVGIASIGFFYILTLYLGLGAMTSGTLDPTNSNMAAPLLARSFGELPFAVISAIAFTTVLGTVSGLILAASGAVAHDLATGLLKLQLTDHEKVRIGKLAAIVVGIIGIVLGIVFEKFNVTFLVGWAFNVAASANLPALVMLLFWRGTTKEGITASIFTGLFSSLAWVLLSGEAYKNIYGLPADQALVPFSQPALVTLPLAFVVLVVVSLVTGKGTSKGYR
jgi:cation/acetate symporter